MARVIWAPQAREVLRTIRDHIARDSRQYAGMFIQRVTSAVTRLEQFPRSGRVIPEFGKDHLREVIVQNYRILYVVGQEDLQVVSVIHGARQLRDIPEL